MPKQQYIHEKSISMWNLYYVIICIPCIIRRNAINFLTLIMLVLYNIINAMYKCNKIIM